MPAARVSPTMKRLGIAISLGGIAAAIWYLRRPPATSAASTEPPEPPRGARASSPPTAQPTPPQRIDHVTRLANAEERQKLADRIAGAQSARASGGRAATSAPTPPRLPDDAVEDTPISRTQIRDAMHEVIPIIKECYEKAIPTLKDPNVNFTATITLSGDPDIGTVVDADQLVDDQGQTLPAAFDDCLRSTFQTLALPPLAEGGTVVVHYPFRFAQK